MFTETITWYTPAERLPDADLTVLVRMPEGWDEPVTKGYLDGEQWREADGTLIDTPALWAELPTGDAPTRDASPADGDCEAGERCSCACHVRADLRANCAYWRPAGVQECFPMLDPNVPEFGSRYPDKGCYRVGCRVHGGPGGFPVGVALPLKGRSE